MAQIFHRSFNTLSKVSIFGGLFIVLGVGWAWAKYIRSDYVTGAHVVVDQPVPFSHEHHVGKLGIDCRYCHTSVEVSPFAGIPPTRTCMNCHDQIWVKSDMLQPVRLSLSSDKPLIWNRVHNLPGFVYFDHSIHVHKGVGCSTCHGRVDRMPLTRQVESLYMEWCLECHRAPQNYVRPREYVFDMTWNAQDHSSSLGHELVEKYHIQRRTDCSVCHR